MPGGREVRGMFARIARRYDLSNRVLSLGLDQRWRARVWRRVGDVEGALVADVATGTGDLAWMAATRGARVVGVDFTREMIALAPRKARAGRRGGRRPLWVQGDALALPLEGGRVDLVTIGFGLRNVEDRTLALREFARVLRVGGRLAVLEFGMPHGRIGGRLYRRYFTRVLPHIGGWISGDRSAYEYLPATVLSWPAPDVLAREIDAAGFEDCRFEPLMRGIAYLHTAVRRDDSTMQRRDDATPRRRDGGLTS